MSRLPLEVENPMLLPERNFVSTPHRTVSIDLITDAERDKLNQLLMEQFKERMKADERIITKSA